MKASCLWPSECQVSCQGQIFLSSSGRDTRSYRLLWLMGGGGGRENVQATATILLDRNGLQDYQEALVEVFLQSLLYHQNLVNLIGYYAGSNRLLLLYDCVPWASLKDRLYGKILNSLSKLRNIRLVRRL